jgi:hypothetical protein
MIGNITAGLYAPSVPPVPNSYESIATVTVGSGGQATVSFTSIPSTYKHLQLRFIARTTSAVSSQGNFIGLRFNSDTSANYYAHQLRGEGSGTPNASAFTTQSTGYVQRASNANNGANIFGTGLIDVLDYTSTTKYKTVRNLGGYDANGSGQVILMSNLWYNSTIAAISTILLTPEAGNFAEYSSFALYGIKD